MNLLTSTAPHQYPAPWQRPLLWLAAGMLITRQQDSKTDRGPLSSVSTFLSLTPV
uniref:Uncharacterized protein n=1 Tax=Anguilla anguilla TaxID=7936 RepID=A0A0E9WBS2_ANGAN